MGRTKMLASVLSWLLLVAFALDAQAGLVATNFKVKLNLDGEGWASQNTEEPSRAAFLHEGSGFKVELLVIDATNPAYRPSSSDDTAYTGAQIVAEWDQQFRNPQPLVEVVSHQEETLDEVTTQFGHLRFQGRVGLYYGFSSADIAASKGGSVDTDRFAYFVLIEGPETTQEALDAVLAAVKAGIEVK